MVSISRLVYPSKRLPQIKVPTESHYHHKRNHQLKEFNSSHLGSTEGSLLASNMLAVELIAALASLSLVQAFHVPSNTPNGIYAFRYDGNGTESHLGVADIDESLPMPRRYFHPATLLPSRFGKRWGSGSINAD